MNKDKVTSIQQHEQTLQVQHNLRAEKGFPAGRHLLFLARLAEKYVIV